MKKVSLLAASIALVLGGCGGSDDNSVAPQTFPVKAIDGYLSNAKIYVGDKCETLVGTTDINGVANVDLQYKDQKLCVKAIAGETLDSSRGIVTKNFELKAPADSAVISPMTDLVVDKMAADTSLTAATAQQEVAKQFGSLGTDSDTLFGDYIAKAQTGDKAAQGITVIGETLVDDGDKAKDNLEQLVGVVADKVESDDDDLEDFDPVIGDDGNFVSNHRPHITLTEAEQDKLEEIQIEWGADIEPISLAAAFADKDNDSFDLIVQDEDGQSLASLGLMFDEQTQVLTGKPVKAGDIELHVYATDSHGARSYPLEIEIDVNSPNLPPVVDAGDKTEIQQALNELALTQGNAVNQVIELDDLFDDEDDDNLKLTVTADIPGLTLTIVQQDELKISGTPTTAGEYSFTVSADDGKNTQVNTELTLSIADNGVAPEPGHPLEGKTWYVLEYGSDDGAAGSAHARVWCDTYKFSNGKVFMNQRSLENLTECSIDAKVEMGTYKLEDDKLMVSFPMEDGEVETSEVVAKDALKGIGAGAKQVAIHGERYTFFANEEDAEKRLDIDSDDTADERSFNAELPAMTDAMYQLGTLSLQMSENNDGSVQASIFFDVEGADFTCEEAQEFYHVTITDGVEQLSMSAYEGEEENIFCSFGTSFTPVKDTVYSIIGEVTQGDESLVEPVKANIEWTGIGDND